jgi:hypothetical protein
MSKDCLQMEWLMIKHEHIGSLSYRARTSMAFVAVWKRDMVITGIYMLLH